MTHEELYEKSGQSLVGTSVGTKFWTGAPQHSGQFTENNPYYIQLQSATNEEDIDALYAQAVEWQATYYNTLEEREYNSPLSRVMRDKEAGINSDILAATGGASSGSSPAGSSIQSPQTDAQYSSVGSRTGRVLESINTACNVVSTVASFGTAVIGAVKQMKTLPAEVSLAESQAYVAEQTKDALVESADLSNIHNRLSLVNQLSGYFTPDSTDDDFTNVLSTLGLSAEMIPQYRDAIRNYHSNPAFKANYEDAITRATEGSVRNSIRTSEVLSDLYERTVAIEQADQAITQLVQSIEQSFNQYLVDNGYGEMSASNITGTEKAKSQALDLTRVRLKRDIVTFAKNLDDVRESVHGIDARIQAIAGYAKAEHRMVSATEQFEMDTLTNLRNQLMTLGSSQLQSVYAIMNNANAIVYQNSEMLTVDGNPIINAASPRYLRTINTTFGNMVTSDNDIIQSLIQSVPFVGSIFTSTSAQPGQQSGTLGYTATY